LIKLDLADLAAKNNSLFIGDERPSPTSASTKRGRYDENKIAQMIAERHRAQEKKLTSDSIQQDSLDDSEMFMFQSVPNSNQSSANRELKYYQRHEGPTASDSDRYQKNTQRSHSNDLNRKTLP
jgi:hypothetical protein